MDNRPRTEGDRLAELIMRRAEIEAQKKRAAAQFKEEIDAYTQQIMDIAEHSAQIPLPLED